jgi:arylsulfatase A-like enzyme
MVTPIHYLRAVIIGSGFIGPVPIEVLRPLGVRVTALLFGGLLGLGNLSLAAPGAAEVSAPRKHPNVLFIPVDDLKPLLGCYGAPLVKTPNMDRLAARGTVFRRSYCQQALCGPTRASLLTGLYPDSAGVWDLVRKIRDINPDIVTLPQHFRQHGYQTANLGKTFDSRNTDPGQDSISWSVATAGVKYDADEAAIKQAQAIRNAYHNEKRKTSAKDSQARESRDGYRPATECLDLPEDAFTDGELARQAAVLMKQLASQGQPFFLSVGFAKPHLPFEAPKKYWDLYRREDFKLAPFQERATNSPAIAYHNSEELRHQYSDIPDVGPLTPEMQAELIHGYYACVSFVDAQVGRLLDELDRQGLADNTIICLWGDHGFHLGDHGLWCKHSNFEQATHAPLIISAPGLAASQSSAPVGFIDIYPTMCDLAGLPKPAHLQGLSLAPLMKNSSAQVREAVLSQYPRTSDGKPFLREQSGNGVDTNRTRLPVMGYTLRSERHRYVKWIQMDYARGERVGQWMEVELYDYQTDPHETVNLARHPRHRDVVERFETIFKQMGVAQHTNTIQSLRNKP